MKKTELFFLFFAVFLIAVSLINKCEIPARINIQRVHLTSIEDVIDIDDSIIVPVLYDSIIVNQFATPDIRKKQFINQVLPAVLIVRFQMENKSRRVGRIIRKIENNDSLNINECFFVDSLISKYRAKTPEDLLIKLKPTPTSLVLAQAIVESGWGSSRFARKGNNLFGVWSTSDDPHVIKSLYNRENQSVFVKKYSNIAESINHYFLTIGRHKAYSRFRMKRYEEVDVFQLIDELSRYSETGLEYTRLLKKIIEWNDLEKYDHYTIDPDYIIKDYSSYIKRKIK